MIIILLVAAGLRLWALPQWPLGLHYDEAANAILTQQIAAGDYTPLFIHAYTGKEVLFFYAAAPWVAITGKPALGLRLGSAMIGILTVAATFSATRALLGKERQAHRAAVLAAGWMAIAFPHVLLSRYGFRAIAQPLLQALTVAAIWHGLRSGQRWRLILGGICLGLTGYTYLAARLFPIPLAIAFGWLLLRTQRQHLGALALVLAAALITFAPLGLHFLSNPGTFSTRITQVASASFAEALHGLWLCVRALLWPGTGDAYVRFNAPGRPLLDPLSALLACAGVWSLWSASRRTDAGRTDTGRTDTDRAARIFLSAVIPVMLLPSALATGEITPSNLRLVGLWPFLAILPALGALEVSARIPRIKPRVWKSTAYLLLSAGAVTTGIAYRAWVTSGALFYAADGEMVLAAQVLDATDLSGTTVYIASEHYRHPTVAALARQYPQAKWLTGGATLVLPPSGDALTLIPRTQTPPYPWPEALAQAWVSEDYTDPDGKIALSAQRLSAKAIAALRPAGPAADFAHVVRVYAASLNGDCHVAEPCHALVTWEALAPYPALEPVVRLLHPDSGEWTRTMAFHYPPEEWTPGDTILDQLTFTPPTGTPPGDGYRLGVGFFNPDAGTALPRLVDETFAGLDARFPAGDEGFTLLPAQGTPTEKEAELACPGIPRYAGVALDGVNLLGWNTPPATARPGERLSLTLCWQSTQAAPPVGNLQIILKGPEETLLYAGPPASQHPFEQWQAGEILEERHTLRYPKDIAPGNYALWISTNETKEVHLGDVQIQSLERTFEAPGVSHPLETDFRESGSGAHGRIRLLGYDESQLRAGDPFTLTLYWQSVGEVEADYTVFVHLVNPADGRIVAQTDEMPAHNSYPTSLWQAGEIVRDPHVLNIPTGTPEGDYTLRTGLYIQETGEHMLAGGDRTLIFTETRLKP